MTPSLSDYARFFVQLISRSRVNHEMTIARLRERDLSPDIGKNAELRVLDLANGQLRPQYYILRQRGHRVYGVDKANDPERRWRDYAYAIARWLYIRNLDGSDNVANDTLVCGDVGALPFPDETFDLVTSVAAFEHFLDVPAVVREVYRVTRRGGMVWVLVHLFSSLSGGHNISLSQVPLRKLPRGVEPWDHLRRRRMPFHVPLNEWRKDQFFAEFQSHFEIRKNYCAMREGDGNLTDEIAQELSTYTRDELTCASYVILACKSK